jgi:hypothetical protein
VNSVDENLPSGSTRRRVIEYFVGGGLLASLASFLYPVMRYLVPPPVVDLGGDEVIAAKVGALKPNSGQIFRFGNHPGLLHLSCALCYLHPPRLHRAVSRRYGRSLVCLSQRHLRYRWPEHFRPAAKTA